MKEKSSAFMFAGKEAAEEYDRAVISNRVLLFLCGTFLFFAVIAFWGYMNLANKITVEVSMPGYEKMIIQKEVANDAYFTVWGEHLVAKGSNFDPQNIDERLFDATSRMKKHVYLENKPKFEKFIVAVKTNGIKQSFVPEIGMNQSGVKKLKTGQVEFWQKGLATQTIGKSQPRTKRCEYTVVMYVEGGELYEDGFKTDCFAGVNDSL